MNPRLTSYQRTVVQALTSRAMGIDIDALPAEVQVCNRPLEPTILSTLNPTPHKHPINSTNILST